MESIHTFAREGDLAGLGQLLDRGTEVDLKGTQCFANDLEWGGFKYSFSSSL